MINFQTYADKGAMVVCFVCLSDVGCCERHVVTFHILPFGSQVGSHPQVGNDNQTISFKN